YADLQGRSIVQGGSTITQQYAKNAYTGSERTITRKIREAVLVAQLDKRADKDEILFRYLSTIYLGEGAYGVGAAAETYFRKPVRDLTLSESALLAGVIPAPSRYEPRGNPTLAEQKRIFVLDRMREQAYITDAEHSRASAERIWLAKNGRTTRPATVVHPVQQPASAHPYFVDYLRRYLTSKFGPELVFRGGLEVRTTISPATQAEAERAVTEALAGTAPPLEMALAAVEPGTGFVRAIVGGRDFDAPDGQVNLALGRCAFAPDNLKDRVDVAASCWSDQVVVEGGGTGRQPGSAWKPIVLAAALDHGIQPDKVYRAPSVYTIPGCRGDQCQIQNYEGQAGGSATLRRATARSFNTVYAQVVLEVGVPEVGKMAKQLGISSAWVANPEVHGPSYSIGVQEVSPLDMASAFGVFASRGLRQPATPVLFIRRPNGELLEDNRRRQPVRALDEAVADNVNDILREVITSGTGTRADIGRPAAGKTGTAQEWRDAWFVGYTPALSAAIWIGNKEKPTSLFDVKGVARVTGGSIPAQTWASFMNGALKDVPPTDFAPPQPIFRGDATPSSVTLPRPFIEETTTTAVATTTTSTTLPPTTTTVRSTTTTTRPSLLPGLFGPPTTTTSPTTTTRPTTPPTTTTSPPPTTTTPAFPP
ncbi:MAG: transglycosylase domain-containing protein, partial [Acidimicrobiales bacterium]